MNIKTTMKRMMMIALMAVVTLMAGAENYPYRSDYLWVTVPDHADWLYKTGEKANIEIQFYKYGIPRNGEVTYTVGNDLLGTDTKSTVTLKNGRAKINIGTKKTPGFRDVVLTMKLDGQSYTHHVKVGFSPEKIQPFTQEPKDFNTFWQGNLDELAKLPLTYTKEIAKEYCTDKVDCYLVKIPVSRRKQCVYGYLFYPKNAQPGKHPVVLCPPGAGIKTIKEPLRHKYYAENGFIRLEIEIHGLDPRLPKETFDDISRAFNSDPTGYLENGIDNRDRYYMKHVYLALVRCIDLLTSLPEWDGRNVAVQGGSQGGALALVAAGFDKRVNLCVVNHPALSDMAGYTEKGRTGGYPHFNRMTGLYTPSNISTMAYYDVVNFARKVKANTYMTWGYNDNTCPPTTSYAVWNTLNCEKESLITPINEHWTSDATEYGQMVWIKKHLQ